MSVTGKLGSATPRMIHILNRHNHATALVYIHNSFALTVGYVDKFLSSSTQIKITKRNS